MSILTMMSKAAAAQVLHDALHQLLFVVKYRPSCPELGSDEDVRAAASARRRYVFVCGEPFSVPVSCTPCSNVD